MRFLPKKALAFVFVIFCRESQAVPLQALAWDEDVASRKLAILDSKGAKELLGLHPHARTEPLNITTSSGAPLRLQALDKLDEKGIPVAEIITISPGIKKPLVLLLPDDKAPTGIRTIVLEDDSSNFKWGTMRMVNTTGRQLLVKCEKKIVGLPESWAPVDVAPGGEARNMELIFALREKPDPVLYSAIWSHNANERKLVFIVPSRDVSQGPVDMKFIVENRAVVEAVRDTN